MRHRSEAGTTLIELMVVAALAVVVLGAILALMDTAATRAPKDQERAHAIREAQVGLATMTRELRQASRLNAWGPNFMDAELTINDENPATSDTWRVRYECSGPPYDAANPTYDRCVRRAARVPDPLPTEGTPVIVNVLNGEETSGTRQVFTYGSGNPPTFVRARIEVPARGTLREGARHDVVFDDGFHMRNLSLGG